jgi:hypothetical protein
VLGSSSRVRESKSQSWITPDYSTCEVTKCILVHNKSSRGENSHPVLVCAGVVFIKGHVDMY